MVYAQPTNCTNGPRRPCAAAAGRHGPEHWAARPGEDVTQLAQRLPHPGVPFYVFLGDTWPCTLHRVLAERHLERIVVTLADIDANLLQQVGYAKSVPLVLSQVVPNPQKRNCRSFRTTRRC